MFGITKTTKKDGSSLLVSLSCFGLSHCLVWDKQRSRTHVREYANFMPYLLRLRHDVTYTISGHLQLPYLPDVEFARFKAEDSDVVSVFC